MRACTIFLVPTKYVMRDGVPSDVEIREVVQGLRNGRAGGPSGIQAEHLKEFLKGMVTEEKEEVEGAGDNWRMVVNLVQSIWAEGHVPQQMLWMTVVLIPKGGGNYRGIRFLEPLWKVVEVLMDKRLQAIEFHDCLHGFLVGRGTVTATIEAKLAQQLAYLEQEAMFGIFIDLCKAYDAMDWDHCFVIMQAYGVGPNICRLLIKHFWDNAVLVCWASTSFGTPFQAFWGVTAVHSCLASSMSWLMQW